MSETQLSDRDVESWKALWEQAFNRYYSIYFEEICAEHLVGWWSMVDKFSRVAIMCTASGSAIAGWALWSQPGFKIIWSIMAGITAFLSILTTVLAVSDEIKNESSFLGSCRKLRTELEAFRSQMQIGAFDSITKAQKDFGVLLERYGEIVGSKRANLYLLEWNAIRLQDKLNKQLGIT